MVSGQMLLKYMLKPLVTCPSLHAVIEKQPNSVTIRFQSLMTDLEHPSPPEAFAKIQLVLEVLQKQLLGVYLKVAFYNLEMCMLLLQLLPLGKSADISQQRGRLGVSYAIEA